MAVRLWLRFGVVITARAVLAVLFGLLFWAVVPLALGWHTTTVMTGSMAPALKPGDLVVSRPLPGSALRRGQVILVRDPDHPDRLRLHRLQRVHGAELITKGDANAHVDSTPIERDSVIGVGYLRVPWIGAPILGARGGDSAAVIATVLTLSALTAAAAVPASARSRDDSDSDSDGTGGARVRRTTIGRHRSGYPVGVAAIATAALIVGAPAPATAAPFSASTTTLGTLQAAIAHPVERMWCSNNWDGTATVGWSYSGEAPSGFDVLIDGVRSLATLGPSARTITLGPNSPFAFGSTSTIRVRTNLTPTWTAMSTSSVRVTTQSFLWIGVVRCS